MLNFSHFDLPTECFILFAARILNNILLLSKSIFTFSLFFIYREHNGIMITTFCYVVLSSFVRYCRHRRRLRQSPMVFNCNARISLFPIEQFDFGAATTQKLSEYYKNCAAPYKQTEQKTHCACVRAYSWAEGRLNRNIGLGWGLQFHFSVYVFVWYLIATMQFQYILRAFA